jgi:hypothetical protein
MNYATMEGSYEKGPSQKAKSGVVLALGELVFCSFVFFFF